MKSSNTYLERILRSTLEGMIKYPEQLDIREESTNRARVLYIHPHAADYPKLVGANGIVIQAIKYIFEQIGADPEKAFTICLQESPVKGDREPREHKPFDPNKDHTMIGCVLGDLLTALGQPLASFRIDATSNGHAVTLVQSDSGTPIDWLTLGAISNLFAAWGRAQGFGKVSIRCDSVPQSPI